MISLSGAILASYLNFDTAADELMLEEPYGVGGVGHGKKRFLLFFELIKSHKFSVI